MNEKELHQKLGSISNADLAEKAKSILSKLCKTGGQSFRMSVPVALDDTDMILLEVVRRFESLSSLIKNKETDD